MEASMKIFFSVLTLMVTVWVGTAHASGKAKNLPELKTVEQVDLNRYLGQWFEIASFPKRFQRDCTATTATYSLRQNGDISVVNSCKLATLDGKLKEATGKAWVVDKVSNAKLLVQFFWPFSGDYWIVDLAKDYSYAVVGSPDRDYLWILSRTPTLNASLYSQILARITTQGFDVSRLHRTWQPGFVSTPSP